MSDVFSVVPSSHACRLVDCLSFSISAAGSYYWVLFGGSAHVGDLVCCVVHGNFIRSSSRIRNKTNRTILNTLSFKCPLFRRSFVNLALSSSVIATIFPLMPDQTSIWPFLLQFTTKEFRKPNLFYHVNSLILDLRPLNNLQYNEVLHMILSPIIYHHSPITLIIIWRRRTSRIRGVSERHHCTLSRVLCFNSHQDRWKLRPVTRNGLFV